MGEMPRLQVGICTQVGAQQINLKLALAYIIRYTYGTIAGSLGSSRLPSREGFASTDLCSFVQHMAQAAAAWRDL